MGTSPRAEHTPPDFAAVDRRLREILEPLRSRLTVTKDGPDGIVFEVPGSEGKPWGYVAGVRPGKRYVAFHLMSVYASPQLMASMSPGLRRRMQGKSCFNFTTVDEPLFEALATITNAGLEPYLARVAEIAREKGPARSRSLTRRSGRQITCLLALVEDLPFTIRHPGGCTPAKGSSGSATIATEQIYRPSDRRTPP